jgi:MFS family permease
MSDAPAAPSQSGSGDLRGYMASQFAFFTAASMMGLLYPWIYTQVLHLPANQVGIAQSVSQIPLLLVLFGGATADGRALSAYLSRLQLAFIGPALLLLVTYIAGVMTFPVVVLAAFAASVMSAFIMPARDAMLTHAAPSNRALTQAVAAATSSMFAGQMLGFALGSLASSAGLKALLAAHIIILVLAAVLTSRQGLGNSGDIRQTRRSAREVAGDISEGLRVTWRDTRLRTITMIVAGSSIAMNSAFVVGLPLLVRDYYKGTSAGVAALFIAFMVGTTITSIYLSRRKPIEAQGRVFMTLFLNSAVMFFGVHLGPPFWVAVLLIFGWGLGAGFGMVLTRSIIQAAAPAQFRARVLSVFQLAQTIGSLIGPFLLGWIIHTYGVLDAMLAVPCWVLLLWAIFSATTPVWSFRRQEDAGMSAVEDALTPAPLTPTGPQEYLRSDHQGKKGGISDDTLPGN